MIGTQIGDLILIRLLGEGGMGAVYLAQHALLNDLQAVKILDARFTQNQQIVTRFLNEGRAAVKLRHRNLVAVHDVGRLPGDGPWYMVMEFLDGGTLAGFMASHGGPISTYETLEIIAQALSCLQYMHDRGVIHRDLKPDNLFLIEQPDNPRCLKVLDLGIAQISEAIATGPGTSTGVVMGTPLYMAIEQLRGGRVTAQADLFAIGVIIYEMLTGGWFPWQRDDESCAAYRELPATELYFRQATVSPIDPRLRLSGIPEGWARTVLRVVDRVPERRPESGRALVNLLIEHTPSDGAHESGYEIVKQRARELLRGNESSETLRPPYALATSGRSAPPALPSTLAGAASQSLPHARSRRYRGLVIGATSGVLAAGVVGILAVSRSHVPHPQEHQHVDITTAPPPVPAAPVPAAPVPAAPVPAAPVHAPLPKPVAGQPAQLARKGTGELEVFVQPWAEISLDGKSVGQTPYRKRLPAGRYRLQLVNEDSGKTEAIVISVTTDQTTTIRRAW